MSKATEVLQKPDEHPSDFYKRLREASHLYMPSDPEALKNQWMVNAAFMDQAQGAIWRKLQTLEELTGMNGTQLPPEVVNKIFMNQEQTTRRGADKRMK